MAILVILLILAANFESVRLALIVISTTPAVLVGVVILLLISGTSLNLESFMGAIMAIGVAVANAILLVTFAEKNRKEGQDAATAARNAAGERLRPVLMTSLAMIAGMIPMALAIGRGSEEVAPLGRAVIGGLLFATAATLLVLPTIFAIVQRHASIDAGNDLLGAEQTTAADRAQVEAAQHGVLAAKEASRSVTQLESYLEIRAPFDGVVTERNLHPGALVGPSSGQAGALPILRIEDIGRLRLVVPVPEQYVSGVRERESVAFTVPAYPGQLFHAPIARISDSIDQNTRTMAVELDVRNAQITPGTFANVRWPVQRDYATLFVPPRLRLYLPDRIEDRSIHPLHHRNRSITALGSLGPAPANAFDLPLNLPDRPYRQL